MAIAFVQSNGGDAGGAGTSTTLAFASNNTLGSGLIAILRTGADCTVTVTDTQSNSGWHEDVHQVQSVDGYMLSVWSCPNCKAGANTVNFNFNGVSTSSRYIVAEYSGLATASMFDKKVATESAGTFTQTPTSSSATPTNASSLVLGILAVSGLGGTLSAGSGYTLRESADSSERVALEDKILAASSAQTASFSNTVEDNYAMAIVVYNGAGTGSTTITPGVGSATLQGRAPSTSAFTAVRIREVLVNNSGQVISSAANIRLMVWYGGQCKGQADFSVNGQTCDPNGTTSWSIATGALSLNDPIFYVAQDSISFSNYAAGRMIPSYE